MIASDFSFIIPVYNRPEEVRELLESFCELETPKTFEIVIVEDGSSLDARLIVEHFQTQLNISYYYKQNTGPGDSRNYGMQRAKGHYFVVLDSDCMLPKHYLNEVITFLDKNYVDCYGGPDTAKYNFSELQKAINFSMTSLLTTGGIRGGDKEIEGYQPRSFNMGISKEAYLRSGGFGRIHPGEDPDLSIRLKKLGFNTKLYRDLKVFHKRRISAISFFYQVYKFGVARSILNNRYPKTKKIIYWYPLLFLCVFLVSIVLFLFKISNLILIIYLLYFLLIFVQSSLKNNLLVGLLSIITTLIQFMGYGYGFFKSFILINIFPNKKIESIFPKMFFNHN